jgi:glycosyltransferase involved in cell wall biosynthesis
MGNFVLNAPKVSIIIPVYNVEAYLVDCLESIVNQSLKDIEIICINDGSTDNSLEILNEYAQKDNRIVIISQENQGQGVARNNAIGIANGEYILFVDPDDWIEEGALETLYSFAKEKSAQVVRFDYKDYNEHSGKIKDRNFAKQIKRKYDYDLISTPSYSWKTFKKGCLINLDMHVWAYFYSTDFIKNNLIKFAPTRRGEDQLFANSAILLADKIYYLDKYLYFYRCRKGSAVNTKDKYNMQVFENIRLMKEFLIEHSLYEELKEENDIYAKTVFRWNYDQCPEEMLEEYKNRAREYFSSDREFKTFLRKAKTKRTFIENIFSLKTRTKEGIKYKVVTIFGLEFQSQRGVLRR